jgi:putative nucleotidyltransferase with HDIG domain
MLKAFVPQPAIAGLTMAVALSLVVPSWIHGPLTWRAGYGTLDVLLSLALMVATLLAFQFSIHIGDNTKINMNSVPLYLMAALLFLPTALVYLAFRSSKEMREGTRQVLESMADYVDLRDPYTGGHSRRVMELTAGILSEMPKDGPEAQLIIAAARVHDIGKIAVPDDVLRKAGKLSSEERLIMRSHAERGAELLMRYPDFARVVDIVRHHHERWDEDGYPHRLKGKEIPLGARIIAVADSFDAITSDRPYRRALSRDKAASILIQGRAKQWDPTIVDAFLRSIAHQLHRPATAVLRIVPTVKEPTEASVTA